MILADKIIELRKKNGWSQEDLAEKLNVSRQSISKWEGAQSVPDMNKILMMSEIFGVSTDYLLKDEIESSADAAPQVELKDDECELRSVSMEEASAFLEMREKVSRAVSIGVMLCILSPIALILLGGMAEYGKISLTESMAAGAGLVILFLMVGPAVALFIRSGMASDKYEYMEKELIDTQYGVDGMAKMKRERYAGTYAKMMVAGIVLCVVSSLPIFFTMMAVGEPEKGSSMEVYYVYAVAALLAMVAAGVYMIIRTCVIKDGYDMLLEEGDYTRSAKVENKKNNLITTIYWTAAVALYLGVSFVTNNWQSTWIIWPIAGVLYALLIAVLRLVRSRG